MLPGKQNYIIVNTKKKMHKIRLTPSQEKKRMKLFFKESKRKFATSKILKFIYFCVHLNDTNVLF